MPLVRIDMFPGRTHAQKQELARVITEAVVTIAHTTPEAVTIIFNDVPKENWAVGGVLISDRQRAGIPAVRNLLADAILSLSKDGTAWVGRWGQHPRGRQHLRAPDPVERHSPRKER